MKLPFYYFANFKMFLSYADLQEYLTAEKQAFINLANNPKNQIALLPGELALTLIATIFQNSKVLWGAQNSAVEEAGPFTGQTSAQSLAELECSYALVGHDEVRKESRKTDADFAHQAGTLLDLMISPIFCIGESSNEMEKHETIKKLQTQLAPLIDLLKKNPELNETPLFIAYEPLWAIGSGKTPTSQDLTKTFDWLRKELDTKLKGFDCKLIYGGSVNGTNSQLLKQIPHLDGFLIGKATLDFQEFKKIVD